MIVSMAPFRRRLLSDWVYAVCTFYKSPKFALLDLTFILISLFTNPYRTCRKFLQKRGVKNIYAYGETPYLTYQRIVHECGIGPDDTWVELGAGRGKGCFWLSHFIKCKVIGVEWVPQFVFIANVLRKLFRVRLLDFYREDIEKVDLSKASVIYLYGMDLAQKIPANVKIIAISEPLEGYPILKSFWVRFPWGRTAAYLQKK